MKKLKWEVFEDLDQLCNFVNNNSYINVQSIIQDISDPNLPCARYRLIYWEDES